MARSAQRLLMWLLLCCAVGLAGVPRAAAQTPQPAVVVLTEGGRSIPITSGVDTLIEQPGHPLSLEQALASPGWVRHGRPIVNLSRQATPAWVRVTLRNEASHPWVLAVEWPLLEQLRFHRVDPARAQVLATLDAGLTAPPGPAGFSLDRSMALELPLRAGEQTTVLMRVVATSAVIVPLTAWEPKAYVAHRFGHNLVMGVLFGILAILLLYNVSLYLFTRDSNYGHYAIYLVASILFVLTATGFGPLLWGHDTWLTTRSYELFICLTYLTGALLIVQALELRTVRWRHLLWMKYVAAVFWAAAALLVVLRPSLGLSWAISVVAILGGCSAVYAAVFLTFKGHVMARYFAVGWTALLAGGAAHVMSLYGVIEHNNFTKYSQHGGFVIEIMLLSLALADRIKRDRLARDGAQKESLALTQTVQHEREEKIKAQDKLLSLQRQANEELEARVHERTTELEQALSRLESANAELAQLSITDALTQVHNRRYFDEVLAREQDRSARTGRPLALLLVDIDHFKKLNDTRGHLVGDECLRQVAAALKQVACRATDLVARYGGEEFALVLPDTAPEHAAEMAERVRRAVAEIRWVERSEPLSMSVSVGVVSRVARPAGSETDDIPEPASSWVAQADAALYRAKAAGRNRVMLAEA